MKPLAILNALDYEYKKLKYPSVPLGSLPRSTFKQNSANEIEKSIVACIRLHGFQASRIKVMGRPLDTRKKYIDVLGHTQIAGSVTWIPGTATKGMADIDASIVPAGGSYAASVKIEVKYKKDRQRPDQKKYETQVINARGFYIIFHSFDEFWHWFEEFTGIKDHFAAIRHAE